MDEFNERIDKYGIDSVADVRSTVAEPGSSEDQNLKGTETQAPTIQENPELSETRPPTLTQSTPLAGYRFRRIP
jgi:hypothetical protein